MAQGVKAHMNIPLAPQDSQFLTAILAPFQARAASAHLGGYCIAVTCAAETYLNRLKFLGCGWIAVQGDFTGRFTGHAWLETNEHEEPMILDLTACQFGLASPLLVTRPDHRYTPRERGICSYIEGFKTWLPPVEASLIAAGYAL